MARQVLPFVGAAVGFVVGGPTGAQIGFTLGAIVGNAVDPQVISGPKIGESALQTSAEGVFRPIVLGTGAVKGNVIARGNRQVKTQRTQQGKGGGPVVEEQRVYWTFAIRIAEPLDGILRIWQDEKLVYDVRPESAIPAESAQYAERFRFYDGSETQLPDPDLEAFMGVGNVSAYRGSAYVVFPNFDLTDRRESIPDFRFEVMGAGSITPPVVVGKWIIGPVAQNGIAGGSQRYFRSADSPSGLSTGTLHEIPAWMATLERISSANETVFLQTSGDDGAVSFDHGATFTQCSEPLDTTGDVYWNGTYYVCRSRRSLDGITWEAIPNLSGTPNGTIARLGAIVCAYAAPDRFEVSFNNGLTWDVTFYGAFISNMATDGNEIHWTAGSIDGRFTQDMFVASFELSNAGGLPLYTAFFGGGTWIRKGLNGRVMRSVDGGFSYGIAEFGLELGAQSQRSIAYSTTDGWALTTFTSLSPADQLDIRTSSDAGATWMAADTVYGNGGSLLFSGGGSGGGGTDPQAILLSSIVSFIHNRIGHDASRYDVSELTDVVAGIVFAGDYTAADAIRTLCPVYSFDASEYDNGSGYRIHYPKRGKPVVTTLTIDNLIQAPEKTVREDALERPKRLHLHYENPTVGYAPAKATIVRNSPDVMVVGERSIQVPVSFTDVDEPAQIADKLMRIVYVEIGGEEEFTVPDNLIGLVPSDCIGVSLRGQVRRMRIVRQDIIGGRIAIRLIPDRQSAYTSNVTGVPVPPPTPPLPSIVGETIYNTLDIPALNDNNDFLLWYDAASGQTPAWYGAQTQHKSVSDLDFQNSATFNINTIMGTLMNTVPAASEHYTDTTNHVEVLLFTDDVLDDLTEAQFLSEGGSFALEKPGGGWEVMQYQDSVDEGDNTFTLTTLARGRLNSGSSNHLPGARFVLLEGVRSVDAVTAYINTNLTHRAVSFGNSPDSADQTTELYTAKSQTEFPVAEILGEIVGTSLNLRAVPRHRFGTELNPVRSINWTGYRWSVTDGVNSSNADVTSDLHSVDITGWGSPITATVSQLNRFTGPGPSVSEDFP